MDFSCDLYCYESDQGYVTHVASNRVVGDIPKTEGLIRPDSIDEFLKAHKEQMKFLDSAERNPIGLPHDGVTFCDTHPEEFMITLRMLRNVGYVFPDYVLECVQEEIDGYQ